MEFTNLKRYMNDFSLEQLKDFLGRDIVDSLIEWTPNNQTLFTRIKLIEMIITIYGLSILKNNDFRKQLLARFREQDILSFKEYLPKELKTSENINDIAEYLSHVPWRKSNINTKLLEILSIDPSIFDTIEDEGKPIDTIFAYDKFYELLDYQYVIRQNVLNNLNSEIELNRMLIQMPTGTGKTKTATHIISHYYSFNLKKKGLIIWLAHTTELLQQAYDTFINVWKHIGDGEIKTYKLWGKYDIEDNDELEGFMVCGIQKLLSIKNSNPTLHQKLIENCRLIVFDEAHKAAASETRTLVESFLVKKQGMQDRSLVGLTATPGRATETCFDNELLTYMFGNKLISIDTHLINQINLSKIQALNTVVEKDIIKYFQDRRVLAKVTKQQLTYSQEFSTAELNDIRIHATSNGYDDFTAKALEAIGKNKSRNLTILQKLRELNANKIPTIVFACSVKHGQLLSSMLTIEGIPNSIVIGDMSSIERTKAISDFKDRNNPNNILINYEVLTTGFDSTNIRCVFITRPTQSVVLYSQMLGRGLRGPQMGGNEECLLIDIKDNLVNFNENMAFHHFNNYWKV